MDSTCAVTLPKGILTAEKWVNWSPEQFHNESDSRGEATKIYQRPGHCVQCLNKCEMQQKSKVTLFSQ